jgi:uncharacterized protein (DUF952 family)
MAIFKILPEAAWLEAKTAGVFNGSPVDLADGFIHFSTASQVVETGRKHFKDQDGLVLAEIDADALGDALRYEPSRGGELFPHLYGPMPVAAVLRVVPLPKGADGCPSFEGVL